MPVNSIFEPQDDSERSLLNDLVVESIEIYGQNMYYLPKKTGSYDVMYAEDDTPVFDQAILCALYIKSTMGFGGDRNIFTTFGAEIRDKIDLVVSRSEFANTVISATTLIRPREGDLIYFPLNDKCFEIQFVDHLASFYQLGGLYSYELSCDLYEYSSEIFRTGIDNIDKIQRVSSLNIFDWSLVDENGNMIVTETNSYILDDQYDISNMDPLSDNDQIQSESDTFVLFDENDPFADGTF